MSQPILSQKCPRDTLLSRSYVFSLSFLASTTSFFARPLTRRGASGAAASARARSAPSTCSAALSAGAPITAAPSSVPLQTPGQYRLSVCPTSIQNSAKKSRLGCVIPRPYSPVALRVHATCTSRILAGLCRPPLAMKIIHNWSASSNLPE